jgi:hypothetical protein
MYANYQQANLSLKIPDSTKIIATNVRNEKKTSSKIATNFLKMGLG